MSEENICRGCFVIDTCNVPHIHGEAAMRICPCTVCLIKSMCNHSCEDYDKFDWIISSRGSKYESPTR